MRGRRQRGATAPAARRAPLGALAAAIALAALAGALALATGCARSQPSTPAGSGIGVPGSAEVTALPAPTPPPADLAHLALSLTPLWDGFDRPVGVFNAGDGSGRLFVPEQSGRIKVISHGVVQKQPYLDLSGLTRASGERGLLGMAFSPGYARDGRVYVNYTDLQGNTVIARYTASEPASDAPGWSAPTRIFYAVQPYLNHNGGNLVFSPDGLLYFGMGDGGSAGDPQKRAQNPGSFFGKILRVDTGDAPNSAPGVKTYLVPPDNPFVGQPGYLPEIWSMGLRNPWRFSFDASSGALWIGDVGQDVWEEIDYAPADTGGQNWGWNLWEGNHPYPSGSNPSRDGFTFPVHDYPHPQGESVTGGFVYRGSLQPALVGTYIYADFIKGWFGGIRIESPDGKPLAKPEAAVLLQTQMQPSGFGVDEGGELYVADYRGAVLRVDGVRK